MPQKNNKLSIIVPIYNESLVIEKFLNKLQTTFEKIECKYIFINDGSNDETNKKIRNVLKKKFKNINNQYFEFKKNQGKSAAIKKGIEYIEGDYTLIIDSDLEYSTTDALELYNIAKKNLSIKIIQGSRYMGGKVKSRKYLFNDIAVRFNTLIFNLLFSQSITDLHTGTKLIKSELLRKLDLTYSKFGLEIDICTQIAKKNITIFEYGIGYIERSKEDGKKITIIDGILSYYYLFNSRFIKNDIQTNISILFSFVGMTYLGIKIGTETGYILISIILALIGLILGIKRKIIALSIIFIFVYIGSMFGEGYSNIFFTFISFLFSLYICKLPSKFLSSQKKNFLFKVLF